VKPSLALLLAAALPASAQESLAVMAVADQPGPEAELAEMTHQLRAACRERTGGVQEAAEMRQRLLGQSSNATLAELERAYGGALATYQTGEYPSSIRTLYAVIDDLEKLPEGAEAWSQWVRAQMRLSHAEATIGHVREAREAMERVLALEPKLQPDPDQYSPSYRREFDAARARVAARPRRKVAVDALGWSATVYVNGKAAGTAPLSVALPPGRYRIGGASGTLRVPSVWIELRDEDRTVTLDFGLAEALRVSAGPGLALAPAQRAAGLVRAGAWLGVDKVLATSIAVEGEVPFLVGSLYDVRRGAVQREGRVRMAAGAVPLSNIGALAAFLLTGQQSKAVMVARAAASPAPVPAPPQPTARPEPRSPPVAAAPREEPLPAPTPVPPPPREPERVAAPAPTPAPKKVAAVPIPPPPKPAPTPAPRQAPRSEPARPLVEARPTTPEKVASAPAASLAGSAAESLRPSAITAPAPAGRRSWMRPAAWGTGAAAVTLAGVAVWKFTASSSATKSANDLVTNGVLRDPAAYQRHKDDASSARTWGWTSLGGSLVFAAAAGTLGYLSWDEEKGPVVRF